MPLLPPVDIASVLLTALLNPVVVVVAFWMGRSADQWQKVPVAAFAAAVLGSAVIYVAVRLGVTGLHGVGRAAAGVFIAEFLFGLAWAALGYRFRAVHR
jgi:hypothetical protein